MLRRWTEIVLFSPTRGLAGPDVQCKVQDSVDRGLATRKGRPDARRTLCSAASPPGTGAPA